MFRLHIPVLVCACAVRSAVLLAFRMVLSLRCLATRVLCTVLNQLQALRVSRAPRVCGTETCRVRGQDAAKSGKDVWRRVESGPEADAEARRERESATVEGDEVAKVAPPPPEPKP